MNDPSRNSPDDSFTIQFPDEPRTLQGGERLGFPAAYSPDAKWLAAAVSREQVTASDGLLLGGKYSPTTLILRSTTETHFVLARPGFRFATLAWKPDAKRIAVLEQRFDHAARSFGAIVSTHPVSYSDLIVDVFDTSGKIVCESLLVRNEPDISVALEWFH